MSTFVAQPCGDLVFTSVCDSAPDLVCVAQGDEDLVWPYEDEDDEEDDDEEDNDYDQGLILDTKQHTHHYGTHTTALHPPLTPTTTVHTTT